MQLGVKCEIIMYIAIKKINKSILQIVKGGGKCKIK